MSEERRLAAAHQEETDSTGRREALKQMGKYAVYTAPRLTALILPVEAAAAREGNGKGKGKGGNGKASPRPHASGR